MCICGETASGKTGLAVALAQRLQQRGTEVGICSSDALAVYQHLDIGTAKPTLEERAGIPHDGLDIAAPNESCNVTDWLSHAEQRIRQRHANGGVTILVGGSPLYLKALLEGLSAGPPKDDAVRQQLMTEYDADQLQRFFVACSKPIQSTPRNATPTMASDSFAPSKFFN